MLIPSFIKMFPEPSEVFADRIEEHSKVLFPLLSIDLSYINPDWSGQVYVIQFNEDPYNQENVKFFNDYCRDCTIGFDVRDNRYFFKSDLKFFDVQDDWLQWLNETRDGYQEIKEYYKLHKDLPEGTNIYEQLGGEPQWIQSDETPTNPDGVPMTFIARVYTSNYTDDSCTKDIYLFYSHKHKIAVQIYQIT